MARGGRTVGLVTSVVVLAAMTVSCSSSHHAAGGSRPANPAELTWTAAGYVIPPNPVEGPAGTLVAAAGSGPDHDLGAAAQWRILYRSNAEGTASTPTRLVSGQVLVPPGTPPAGGWPVVAWAHGTTGLNSRCSPSLQPGLAGDASAVGEVRALLSHHWAVVASDYAGLGTPGIHPYLIGASNGADVLAAVQAAHHLTDVQLSSSYVVVGHSEGGQTALFAAQAARRPVPELRYRGTVALAPASLLEALLPYAASTNDPVEEAYAVYALYGLHTVDPSVDPASIVSKQTAPVLADVTTGCVDQITDHLAARKPQPFLGADDATVSRVAAEIGDHDDPDRAAAAGPILVEQGTADTDVPPGTTDAMVQRLCNLGDDVTYHRVPGADHEQLLPASLAEVTAWIAARFADTPTTGNCGAS